MVRKGCVWLEWDSSPGGHQERLHCGHPLQAELMGQLKGLNVEG